MSLHGAPSAPDGGTPAIKGRPYSPYTREQAVFHRKDVKSRRFPLTARPISYIMLTRKSISFRLPSRLESGWLFFPSAYCPHIYLSGAHSAAR
jgi:hypothetical protein